MKDAAMFYTNRVLKDYKGKYIYVESRPDDVFQIQVNTIFFNLSVHRYKSYQKNVPVSRLVTTYV